MNLDEDMGGGGFKFKKREKKNRIKTLSEKPEETIIEEVKVQTSTLITETISQAHHVQQKPSLEHTPDAEAKKDDEGTPNLEADTKEANVEEQERKDSRAEAGTAEEEPLPSGSIDVTELPELGGEPGPAVKGEMSKKGPKFKQRKRSRDFKSRPPKKGVIGFGEDIPGMDGLGTDITVICPWEAFSHLELHELAQFGII